MNKIGNREQDFRNYMAGDPYLQHHAGIQQAKKQNNFCACGLNASGGTDVEIPEPAQDVNTKVQKIMFWNYAKTALAVIGIYVVGKFLYNKYVK